MKKLLLFLILTLCSVKSSIAQIRSFDAIDKSTFAVRSVDSEGHGHYGTAFCIPGQSSMLMTAHHVLAPGYWVENWKGEKVPVKAQMFKGNDHKDIGTLMMEEPVCQFSGNEWALGNEKPSRREMTLFGYGLGKKIMTVGTISGVAGDVEEFVIGGQFANLNAIGGHSGSPVYNPEGRIVGMLVGSATSLDVMDVIIPVETLRKALK